MPPANCRIIQPNHVVCRQPGRYIGWPTIAYAPWGELLAVFSGDRDAHICPFGKTCMVRSSDLGKTWSAPQTINDTPLDDRDAGVTVSADGTIVVSWFTSHYTEAGYHVEKLPPQQQDAWRKKIASVTPQDIQQWAGLEMVAQRYTIGHWIRRSGDRGRTWEAPIRVPPTAPHGPIKLSSGKLMFVGNDIASFPRDVSQGALVAAESADNGKTWQVVGRAPCFPPHPDAATKPGAKAYLCEAHVAEPQPGRLVGMARYEEHPRPTDPQRGVLWQFDSTDGGRTWTPPRPTAIVGKPPHLLRLSGGQLLVTYGYRHKPFGERACLSRDGGATWDYADEIVLYDDATGSDLGYPSTAELPDGSLYTVYYQAPQAGELRCLMGAHWALK